MKTLRRMFGDDGIDETRVTWNNSRFRAVFRVSKSYVEGDIAWHDKPDCPTRIKHGFEQFLMDHFGYEVRNHQNKIFGIGFPRAGTTTLCMALRRLGFHSLHHAPWMIHDIRARRYRCDTVDEHAGLTDSPFPLIYRDLDRVYPQSRFILTVRPVDEWLQSIQLITGDTVLDYRRMYYGIDGYDEHIYRRRYMAHIAEVTDYFRHRSNDLLVLELSRGLEWRTLCRFLKVSHVPLEPFPWRNRRTAAP